MKRFALIGAGGYIAPRHMKAIKEIGGQLVAALDPCDAVGILDGFFPDVQFFLEPEVFEAYIEDHPVDWVSVASPNYLHEAHIRLGLRHGANVLCEKPLVLEPESLGRLAAFEERTGRRVYAVLQLRVHPDLMALRQKLQGHQDKREVVLTYITSRGPWYLKSWKADERKSGGVAPNIGIHFFDLLLWYFGPVEALEVHLRTPTTLSGYLELERARVRWFLSIEASFLPKEVLARRQRHRFSEGNGLALGRYRRRGLEREHDAALNGLGLDILPEVRLRHFYAHRMQITRPRAPARHVRIRHNAQADSRPNAIRRNAGVVADPVIRARGPVAERSQLRCPVVPLAAARCVPDDAVDRRVPRRVLPRMELYLRPDVVLEGNHCLPSSSALRS